MWTKAHTLKLMIFWNENFARNLEQTFGNFRIIARNQTYYKLLLLLQQLSLLLDDSVTDSDYTWSQYLAPDSGTWADRLLTITDPDWEFLPTLPTSEIIEGRWGAAVEALPWKSRTLVARLTAIWKMAPLEKYLEKFFPVSSSFKNWKKSIRYKKVNFVQNTNNHAFCFITLCTTRITSFIHLHLRGFQSTTITVSILSYQQYMIFFGPPLNLEGQWNYQYFKELKVQSLQWYLAAAKNHFNSV